MAIALALLTSVAYGVSNYVGPRLSRGASLYLLLLAGQTCALLLAAIVVVSSGDPFPAGDAVAFALLAGLGNAGGLVLFYRAAQIGPLSVVTPIGALGVVVPVTVGVLGGETVTALEALGILITIAGVMLVARRPVDPSAAPSDAADRRAALILALLSSVCFGVFLAAIAPAADEAASWAVLLSRLSLLSVLLFFCIRLGVLRSVPASRLPVLAVPGLLLFVGTFSYAVATREGDLSLVSVLGSLFPVVTVALALGLDRERLSAPQALGVVGTLVGVVLLSMR